MKVIEKMIENGVYIFNSNNNTKLIEFQGECQFEDQN